MMSFSVLLLCAVTGHTLCSTLNPLPEMNMEHAVLSLIKQMSNVEERILLLGESVEEIKRFEKNYLEDKKLLEQALIKMSDIEKSLQKSIDSVSNMLQVETKKLLLMNNHLLAEVLDLQKRDLESFQKIVNVENEVRVRTDLLQVRLNETVNMTQTCLASQTQMQETMQKNIETLENGQSNLSGRMGNVENSCEALRKDLDDVTNRQDDTLKLTVQNNTKDIGQLKQDLSRIQTICSPPCENGGQCVKNICNCTPLFTGDRCQEAFCSPPCENGGQCMRDNVCKCAFSFYGDRCEGQCGVDFDNDGNNGGGNISVDPVWPWVAAVYKKLNTAPEYKCEGSVIHRHFVLMSAFCTRLHGTDQLSVKLGLSDLKKGTHLQEYRVGSVHIHPEFETGPRTYDNNYDYGIALLELEEPIRFGPFVRPVCLPPREIPQDGSLYKPESTAKAVNLDLYIRSPQTASPTMLNLTILSQEACRRKMKEAGWEKAFPSPELSFCAESSTTCPIYGSPLMQSSLAGGSTRTWIQVGFRNSCRNNFLSNPRLDHLRTWVEETIAASSKE